MEEMFIEKPVGKPVKNFRARVKMYDNDVVVVNPMEPRESNRRMIRQKGKSSFYKSEGEKESSYSIHINVDANDPDPVATMQEAFNDLTKGELKTEPKLQVKGKLLYDSEYLQVYLNKTQKNVVFKTTLPCSPTIERELLRLQSEMGKVKMPITQRSSKCLTPSRRMKRKPILLQTKKSLTAYNLKTIRWNY